SPDRPSRIKPTICSRRPENRAASRGWAASGACKGCMPRASKMPSSGKTESVHIVRQHRQSGNLDAFVDQRPGLGRRRLADDAAGVDLAIVDFARLFRKFATDVL